MTKKEIMSKINSVESKINTLVENHIYTGKKFYDLLRDKKALIYEYNKKCNYYYHESEWIDKVFNAIFHSIKNEDLTGNDLTRRIATELNKIDGVALEESFDDKTNTLNYLVSVITPYSIYHYVLTRGYSGYVTLNQGNKKTKAACIIPTDHIIELVYGDCDTDKNVLKHLREDCHRNILDKTDDKIDVDALLKDWHMYWDSVREKERIRREEAEKRFSEVFNW